MPTGNSLTTIICSFKESYNRRIRIGGGLFHDSPGTARVPFSASLSQAATGGLLHFLLFIVGGFSGTISKPCPSINIYVIFEANLT